MPRRRMVALASAGVIFLLVLILALAFTSVTQTEFGRSWTRRALLSLLEPAFRGKGKLYVGHMSGGLVKGVTIDSIALRDADDSLFVSTGPLTVTWDPRDLIDKRVLIRALDVAHPMINLRRHSNWEWNFNRIFKSSGPDGPRGAGRSFGDFVIIRDLTIRDGTFFVTQPWEPDDTLHGRARQLAIDRAIAAPEHVVRHTGEGLKKTWTWTNATGDIPYIRIADPDSTGRLFDVRKLDVDEADPPLNVRDLRGAVFIKGDTAFFNGKHFNLPASTGTAAGKVWWGHDLPVRYDITIVADSFALNDVNWAYTTLPRTGGGKGVLTIRNSPRDLRVLDYGLTKLDVRTTKSHLTGAMTFGVGAPVLILKDVDMVADPINFDLIRTLNGAPFPVDWQGELTGMLRGRGGPLNRFVVDSSHFIFRDAHVPGAIARASARGMLDVLYPAFAAFRGLDVNVETFDLRTPQFLFPNFPKLNGTVTGTARLDSVWTDVRFSNADFTHRDGDGPPTHFTGRGRVTDEPTVVRFDVAGDADSLSFTTLAKSYVNIPLRGNFAGPMTVRGTIDDFELVTTLSGAAGTMSVNGRFDDDPPGYFARAKGSVKDLNVRALLDKPAMPVTRLNAQFESDIRFDSLANAEGTVAIDIDRSRADTMRIYAGTARLAFGGGRVRVDSLRVETNLATAILRGALGVAAGVTDSLRYAITADSLGAFRPWIRKPPIKRGASELASPDSGVAPAQRDSAFDAIREQMTGTITVRGTIAGSVADSMRTTGTLDARDLFDAGDQIRHALIAYDVAGIPNAMHGTAQASIDTASLLGVAIVRADARLAMQNKSTGKLGLSASTTTGVRALSTLRFDVRDSSTMVLLDTFALHLRDRTWTMLAPSTIDYDGDGVTLSPITLSNGGDGSIALDGLFHAEKPGSASLRVRRLPLSDIGVLVQTAKPLGGVLDSLDLRMQGTTLAPIIRLGASVDSAQYGPVRLPHIAIGGGYADHRTDDTLRVIDRGQTVLGFVAQLPMDLSLQAVDQRLLPGELRARVSADSVALGVFGAIAPQQVAPMRGTITTELDVSGTWKAPRFAGSLAVSEGVARLPMLGITLNRLNADILLRNDTVLVRKLTTYSDNPRGGPLSVSGAVGIREIKNPVFDITQQARNFQMMRLRRVADVEVTDSLRIIGPLHGARADGFVVVDRGNIYLPELATKQLADLSDPFFASLIDTTTEKPPQPVNLAKYLRSANVQVRLGDDVWLRSREANVKLSGAVDVSRSAEADPSDAALSFAGRLQADRGTYRLDLGLLQRTFDVDSGAVRFYNSADIPPQIDIWATYVVRQLSEADVRIHAHIAGTLSRLTLDLSSDKRYQVSYTEILSYLLFGAPSFAVGQGGQSAVRQAAGAILPTVGSALADVLSAQFGSFFDLFQIQTGGLNEDIASTTGTSNQSYASTILNNTRVGWSQQLGRRFFYSVNLGFCVGSSGANPNQSADPLYVGGSLEYRFQQGFWAALGYEPQQSCRTDILGISSRKQIGFDLFKEWRF
ncbi:MAG: translocation/assembly module TamB [Gemmatimonadota bacterium]|nr:translocation/assembly module TamB [Gemmatimonadota bacterium]